MEQGSTLPKATQKASSGTGIRISKSMFHTLYRDAELAYQDISGPGEDQQEWRTLGSRLRASPKARATLSLSLSLSLSHTHTHTARRHHLWMLPLPSELVTGCFANKPLRATLAITEVPKISEHLSKGRPSHGAQGPKKKLEKVPGAPAAKDEPSSKWFCFR